MAQHDYDIANALAANVRADINNALAAIVSQNSGASAPSTTFANMMWYDTTNDLLKMRNEADSAWITLGYINQTSGKFEPYVNGVRITDVETTITDDDTVIPTSGAVVDHVKTMGGNQSGSAPVYAARAFGEVDSTGTLNWGKNVASASRSSTGVYTINFTTAMPSANYAVHATAIISSAGSGDQRNYIVRSRTTSSFVIQSTDATNNTMQDADFTVTVFA